MANREVRAAPRSPWQSPYVECLIGSVRRECLDHLIVLNEESLRQRTNVKLANHTERTTTLRTSI